MVSATCRYSSWERAYNDVGDIDGESVADSLSRLFDESVSDAGSFRLAKCNDREAIAVHELVNQARNDAASLRAIAMESCST